MGYLSCWRVELTALILLLLGGCASVPIVPVRFDQEAKRFLPPTEGAGIYVLRSKDIIGSSVLFSIQLDDQLAGRVAPGTYLYGPIPPGRHTLTATGGLPPKVASLAFSAELGSLHFFKVGPGWAGLTLQHLSEEEGKGQLAEAQPSGENLLAPWVRIP